MRVHTAVAIAAALLASVPFIATPASAAPPPVAAGVSAAAPPPAAGGSSVGGTGAAAARGSVLPLRLPSGSIHPHRLSTPTLTPRASDDCASVTGKLPRLRAAGQRKVSCTTVKPLTAGTARPLAAPAEQTWCDAYGPGYWWVTRTAICQTSLQITYTVVDARTGAITGTAEFLFSQDMQVEPTSLTWREYDYITPVSMEGTAYGVMVGFNATCTSTCMATTPGAMPMPVAPGEMLTPVVTYTDSPGDVDRTTMQYVAQFVQPDTIPLQPIVSWSMPAELQIRCDTLVGNNPGCVVPWVTPELTVSIADRGESAILIGWAQSLPDGWGVSQPLHRLADDSLASRNRSVMCAGFVADPTVTDDSCDEFPFAKSYESGAMFGLSGSDCAEIKPYLDAGGWRITAVNNITGTEHCVRGHIPLSSNSAVGGDLGRFTQQQRLLDDDPYYLTVTT